MKASVTVFIALLLLYVLLSGKAVKVWKAITS